MEEKSSSKNKHDSKTIFLFLGLCLIIVSVVLIILYFLRGSASIENTSGDVMISESLSCESAQTKYPFFTYDKVKRSELKITTIFDNKKIDKISLVSNLYYSLASEIKESEVSNHAAMNKQFSDDKLGADSFKAVYSLLDDSMQMTLIAEAKQLDTMVAAKYFLLDKTASQYTIDSLAKLYNSKGMDCVIKK